MADFLFYIVHFFFYSCSEKIIRGEAAENTTSLDERQTIVKRFGVYTASWIFV